jgi:hypothetical protein
LGGCRPRGGRGNQPARIVDCRAHRGAGDFARRVHWAVVTALTVPGLRWTPTTPDHHGCGGVAEVVWPSGFAATGCRGGGRPMGRNRATATDVRGPRANVVAAYGYSCGSWGSSHQSRSAGSPAAWLSACNALATCRPARVGMASKIWTSSWRRRFVMSRTGMSPTGVKPSRTARRSVTAALRWIRPLLTSPVAHPGGGRWWHSQVGGDVDDALRSACGEYHQRA